jgi:hypothetical protein
MYAALPEYDCSLHQLPSRRLLFCACKEKDKASNAVVSQRRFMHGIVPPGRQEFNAKFTVKQVLEIPLT